MNSFPGRKSPSLKSHLPGNRRSPALAIEHFRRSYPPRERELSFQSAAAARRAHTHPPTESEVCAEWWRRLVLSGGGGCSGAPEKTSCTLGIKRGRPLPLLRMYTHLGFCLPHTHVARLANQKASVTTHST